MIADLAAGDHEGSSLPLVGRLAAIVGFVIAAIRRAAIIAIGRRSAVIAISIIGAATVVGRPAIVAAVLGCGDGETGADDAGKRRGCGRAAAAAIVAPGRADVGGIAGAR